MGRMVTGTREILIYLKKAVVFVMKAWYTSLLDHPAIWAVVLCCLFMSRFFPSLFGFLVSSAPVIICTAVLLGTLLSFGKPNIPDDEEDASRSQFIMSAMTSSRTSDNVVTEKDMNFSEEAYVDNAGGANKDKMHDESREFCPQKLIVHKPGAGKVSVENDDATAQKKETSIDSENLKETSIDSEKLTDSFHASSWHQHDEQEGSSQSDSDHAESSSPDASLTDINPILDELHPLLDDDDAPKPTVQSYGSSDRASENLSQSHESDPDSEEITEGVENQEKVHEDNEDGDDAVVMWTEDDEKNIKDIRTLELERNHIMECLIAKRVATKRHKAMAERNLIDLETVPIQIPPVTTTRQNPFDLPYVSDESMNVQILPGSAPSVLLPRMNPFALAYDGSNEGKNTETVDGKLGQQQLSTPQQRDAVFCRHESFTLGASFKPDRKTDKTISGFTKMAISVEGSFDPLITGRNDPEICSVHEIHSVSSVSDQQEYREQFDQDHAGEGELLSPETRKLDEEQGSLSTSSSSMTSSSSSSSSSMSDRNEMLNQISYLGGDRTFHADKNVGEEIHSLVFMEGKHMRDHEMRVDGMLNSIMTTCPCQEDLVDHEERRTKLIMNTSGGSFKGVEGVDMIPPETEPELVDKFANGTNSSPSEGIRNISVKQRTVTPLKRPAELLQPAGIDHVQAQAVGPVFDSSPSAPDKYLPNAFVVDDVLCQGRTGISSSFSTSVLDTVVEMSDQSFPSMHPEGGGSFSDSESVSGEMKSSKGFWAVPSNLSTVDEHESQSREIRIISELDVIQAGLSGVEHSIYNSCKPLNFEAISQEVLKLPMSSSSEEMLKPPSSDMLGNNDVSSEFQNDLSSKALAINLDIPEEKNITELGFADASANAIFEKQVERDKVVEIEKDFKDCLLPKLENDGDLSAEITCQSENAQPVSGSSIDAGVQRNLQGPSNTGKGEATVSECGSELEVSAARLTKVIVQNIVVEGEVDNFDIESEDVKSVVTEYNDMVEAHQARPLEGLKFCTKKLGEADFDKSGDLDLQEEQQHLLQQRASTVTETFPVQNLLEVGSFENLGPTIKLLSSDDDDSLVTFELGKLKPEVDVPRVARSISETVLLEARHSEDHNLGVKKFSGSDELIAQEISVAESQPVSFLVKQVTSRQVELEVRSPENLDMSNKHLREENCCWSMDLVSEKPLLLGPVVSSVELDTSERHAELTYDELQLFEKKNSALCTDKNRVGDDIHADKRGEDVTSDELQLFDASGSDDL